MTKWYREGSGLRQAINQMPTEPRQLVLDNYRNGIIKFCETTCENNNANSNNEPVSVIARQASREE
jgi:hypothetical protein